MATKKNTGKQVTNQAGLHIQLADYLIETQVHKTFVNYTNVAQIIDAWADVPINPTTAKTYTPIIRAAVKMNTAQLKTYLERPSTSGSYYKRCAGVKWAITELYRTNKRPEALALAKSFAAHTKPTKFISRKSKRVDNRTIVQDWRTRYLTKLNKTKSQYKAAALLNYLCGMRPHEFTSNLGATIYYDATQIKIVIKGAKVKDDFEGNRIAGITERTIVFNRDETDPAIKMLLELQDPMAFSTVIKFRDAVPKDSATGLTDKELVKHNEKVKKGLNSLIANCGRGLLGAYTSGKHKGELKPFGAYNLRHMFSSTMRAAEMSPRDISRALGHISERTAQYYGRANAPHSGGGVVPVKVSSSELPRQARENKISKIVGGTSGATASVASVSNVTATDASVGAGGAAHAVAVAPAVAVDVVPPIKIATPKTGGMKK